MLRLTNHSTKHVLFGYELPPGFGARIVHPDVTGVAASCIRSIPIKIFFSRSTHSSVSISVLFDYCVTVLGCAMVNLIGCFF